MDDRIPVWPPDIPAIFYGKLSNPEWKFPWSDTSQTAARFGVTQASYEYGRRDPLSILHDLSEVYSHLSDDQTPEIRTRAERAILLLMMKRGEKVLDKLSLGIAAPIREAARTCQLFPPTAWPLQTYMAIGRNDLATSANETVEQFNEDGFKSRKNFLVSGVTLSQFLLEYDVDITLLWLTESWPISANYWSFRFNCKGSWGWRDGCCDGC